MFFRPIFVIALVLALSNGAAARTYVFTLHFLWAYFDATSYSPWSLMALRNDC